MTDGSNEALVRAFMDRAFNRGDISAIDEFNTPDGIDHQEPPGTDLSTHLKQVVVSLRTAFPDLRFEIHDLLTAEDLVAFRSTMTGTHTGTLSLMPGKSLPATGRRVSVPHMHFVRIVGGKTTDLWHLWNMPMMMQQLGAAESAGRPDKAGH